VICDKSNQASELQRVNSFLQDNGYSLQDINGATKARFTNINDMKRDNTGSIYTHHKSKTLLTISRLLKKKDIQTIQKAINKMACASGSTREGY
jgi:ribosomal 50S subunit-associated protein YjgA (DUF615 family)